MVALDTNLVSHGRTVRGVYPGGGRSRRRPDYSTRRPTVRSHDIAAMKRRLSGDALRSRLLLWLLAECCCRCCCHGGLAADADGQRKVSPTLAHGQCPDPALYEHSAAAGRCCRRCPPGRGVWRPCDARNDTVCEACREGVTFSPAEASRKGHHMQQCTACSPSPDHAVVTRQCNATHDTQWECKRGFYFNAGSRSCVQCLRCAEGWGLLVACDHWTDARCIKCPDGTYSSGGGGSGAAAAAGDGAAAAAAAAPRSCIVCTKCSASQVTLHECTSTQDTACHDIKRDKGAESGAQQLQQQAPGSHDDRPAQSPGGTAGSSIHSEFPTVPLYCAILGTVVVGLLLYVVIRCRPNRTRKQLEPSAAKTPMKVDLVALLNGSGKVASVAPRSVHYSEVSVGKRMDAAALLHRQDVPKERNWQGLARLLGFSQLHVNEMAERAQRDGSLAAHGMLEEWCRHGGNSATLGTLLHSLRRLGRTDVVQQLGAAAARAAAPPLPSGSHGVLP